MSNWVRKEQIFFETRSSHDYFLVFFFYRALSWKTSFQLDLCFCRKSLSGVMTHIPCWQIQSKLSNFKMQWWRVQFQALLSGFYTLIRVCLVSFKIFIISHIFRHRCLQRIFLNRGSIWQILRQIVQEWQEKMERRIQRRCCGLLQALSRNEDWKRDYKNATVCFTSFPYHVGSVKYEQHINTYLIRKRTLSYFWIWLQFWNFSSHCKYFCSPLIRALSEGKQQLMKLQPITEKLSNSRNQLELQVNTWKRR